MEAYNNSIQVDVVEESPDGKLKPGYERLVEVKCTPQHQYCSVYSLSSVLCVCQTDSVAKMDLEVLQQYCHFATMEMTSMKPTHKRNMLFW